MKPTRWQTKNRGKLIGFCFMTQRNGRIRSVADYSGLTGYMKLDIRTLPIEDHVPWLDGLRGIAALWVFLYHIQILTGLNHLPILSQGGLAVDLFMVLSGFLMTHHYIQRKETEPWSSTRTAITFWIRRFFRIAPLYYTLLCIGILCGPMLGEYRAGIASVWPNAGTPLQRYYDQSLLNLFAHLSFTFGLLPEFAFRTPLPDWSIGLEMQFYVTFPLIMFLISRYGPLVVSVALIFGCFLVRFAFPSYYWGFEMPALLAFKLHVFLIGIWMAIGRSNGRMSSAILISIALSAFSYFRHGVAESVGLIGITIAVFFIMDNGTLPGSRSLRPIIESIRSCLAGKIGTFMGTTSYATYLLHLLILLPVVGYLINLQVYLSLNQYLRFAVVVGIALPITYFMSWFLYHFVEAPAIKTGKKIIWLLRRHDRVFAPK